MRNLIMLMTGLFVAAAMPGSIAFAAADDAATIKANTETITSCLVAARKANQDGRDCIGRISDPCLEQPGNGSKTSMVRCIMDETTLWDSMLNQEYQRLLGALEGKMATSVRVAQRAWIAARDADCHVTDEITADGAASRINAASCMLGKTGERVIQLRSWWDMAHPEDMAHAEGDTAEDSLPVLTSPH